MSRTTAWLGLVLAVLLFLLPLGVLTAQPPLEPQVTIAQAEATSPGVPPTPVPPSETLSWQLTFGVIVNEVMKRLKQSALVPWMKAGTANANVMVAALLSAIAAAGIHTEFDQVAGTLLITGLTISSVVHFLGEWLRQYALQHFLYYAAQKEAY